MKFLTDITANLSLAFARLGFRAGILDTDIFGPSIPTLFDLSGEPRLSDRKLLPTPRFFFVDADPFREPIGAAHELWRQDNVHGLPRRRKRPRGLARTHGHEGDTTTPP